MNRAEPVSVSELNAHIKLLVDSDPALGSVAVRGELSNYKIYPSGHHYFTLKDQDSSLRCVMFRSSASRLRFRPENGMSATAIGRVSVYPRDGAYQLYCDELLPGGAGDLQAAPTTKPKPGQQNRGIPATGQPHGGDESPPYGALPFYRCL